MYALVHARRNRSSLSFAAILIAQCMGSRINAADAQTVTTCDYQTSTPSSGEHRASGSNRVLCSIMALYTGKGDKGTTKLFNTPSGKRLSKSSVQFEALGTVDELNTVVGWCRSACTIDWLVGDARISQMLLDVQHHLFTVQAELAGAGKSIPKKNVTEIEKLIAKVEEELPEIATFFVPGGSELSSRLDMARAVSRRAERRVVEVHESGEKIKENTLAYMNRLSSLFYALVRLVNHRTATDEKPPEYVA